MRLALKNIQKADEPITRHVQVIRKLGGNKYKVTDVYGREYRVNSAADWKPTQFVAIQNGEIIREVGKLETPKRYKG